MGEAIAFVSLLLFSFNVILTKVAGSRLNINTGFLISISVNVLFSGLLVGIQWLVGGGMIHFHRFGFVMFVISGIFASYLGRTIYFSTIVRLGPAKASAFAVASPLFTVLISWIFLKEALTGPESVAVFVVLFGLLLVSYIPQKSSPSPSVEAPKPRWNNYFQPGILLALFGSIAYALGNITRGIAIQDWQEPIVGGFLGASAGLVLQLLFNKQSRHIVTILREADPKGVRMFAVSGVLTISAQIAQIASMRYIPVSIATLITMSQPLLVIPLSYFLLKNQEGINARIISGSLLVLFGIGVIILY